MAHFSRLFKIVIDVPASDHEREVSFWQAALAQPLPPLGAHPEYRGAALHGQDFWLLTQRLGEGTARVHLDMHTDDLDAEAARLEHLGARRVQRVHSWQVMRDPAGCCSASCPTRPESFTKATPPLAVTPDGRRDVPALAAAPVAPIRRVQRNQFTDSRREDRRYEWRLCHPPCLVVPHRTASLGLSPGRSAPPALRTRGTRGDPRGDGGVDRVLLGAEAAPPLHVPRMLLHGISDVRYVSAVQWMRWRPGPQPEEPVEVLRALAQELLDERKCPGDPNWRDVSQQFQLDIKNPEKSGVLLASAHESRAVLDTARGSAARERGRPEVLGWGLAGALGCYGALFLFLAPPAGGTGVVLAGAAVLAMVFAGRLAWRTWKRAARRRAVTVADQNWREALRDRVLASYLDSLASSLSDERFKVEIRSSAASATSHGRDPELAVETTAMQSVAAVARHIGKGSIGISGPRGAGKSTILANFGIRAEVTQAGRQPARDLRLHVAAPVDYDAREFLVHLFLELCDQVRAGSPPVLLAAEGRRHQERLRFLRSYASTWGVLRVSWTFARTRSEQADGLPAIVGQFRRYSEQVADWKRRDGCRVVICIDEADKIRDSDRAESFLNEIKAIFDVPGCLYLVAISEDAMTVFASRTPAIRTAFDSAFDEIVSVQPMIFTEARDMLDLRFIGIPWPFLALCHVLAGGVPRDLLRAARSLIQAADAPGADVRTLREITGTLVRTRCDILRQEAILQLSRTGAPGAILLPLHGAGWPGRAPDGTRAAVLDPAHLRASADELGARARALGNDEWQQMCTDVSVALRFYAMVIEVFGQDGTSVGSDIKAEQYGLIDDLARARHTMRTNSGLAEDLLGQLRRDYPVSGTEWPAR